MNYTRKTNNLKDKKQVNHYSKEWLKVPELQKILSLHNLSEKYECWVNLLYFPALRVSEAINVRVRDIDFDNNCVEIYNEPISKL
jgi:integrase/recombinase XerD